MVINFKNFIKESKFRTDTDFIKKIDVREFLRKIDSGEIKIKNPQVSRNRGILKLLTLEDHCVGCGEPASFIGLVKNEAGTRGGASKLQWGLFTKDGAQLTIDHIIPKSLGGTYVIDNLQTMCYECNAKKSSNISEWLYTSITMNEYRKLLDERSFTVKTTDVMVNDFDLLFYDDVKDVAIRIINNKRFKEVSKFHYSPKEELRIFPDHIQVFCTYSKGFSKRGLVRTKVGKKIWINLRDSANNVFNINNYRPTYSQF